MQLPSGHGSKGMEMASRGQGQYLGWQGQGGEARKQLSPTSWTRVEGAGMAEAVGMVAFPSPRATEA